MANVLDFASDLGKALYHCGAETYRIEETVKRVLLALTEPNTEVDVFAIPAYLAISVKLPDEEGEPRIHKQEDGTEALSVEAKEGHVLYRSLRMSGVSYNLENLEKINDLSRRITAHKIGLDDAYKELEEITYSRYAMVNATAARARKIVDGSKKLIKTESFKPVSVAFEEILGNKVQIIDEEVADDVEE